MVAEVTKVPPKKTCVGRIEIPLLSRMKVRNLYLGQGLPYKEIAAQTGLTTGQVTKIISKDRLAVKRREKAAQLAKRTDARIDATFQEFEDQAAREAEEISLGALAKARSEVESGGEFAPKNFQAWTAGISNLVKVSRTMRGLDDRQQNAAGAGGSLTLNMFVVQSARDMKPIERNANLNTPAIEVSATQIQSQ